MEQQELTLRDLLDKIANERQLKNYKIALERTTTQGANYTSVLFFATISSDDNNDLKIFAKVACVGEKMRDITPFRIYDTEKLFYTDLIKTFKKLEAKHDVPEKCRYVAPKFYGLSFEYLKEAFALEDLTGKGYQMFDRFKTIDWNYAKEAMTQLARLHALTMAYSIELPDEFEEKTNSLTIQGNADVMMGFMTEMFGRILGCAKDEHKARIEQFLKETATMDKMKAMTQPRQIVVLAHGDYRPSNLMHKLNEDGSYSIIPVDYQTLNRSNPIVDILYFMFSGSDQKFRAQYYQKTLDHYYSELSAALRRFHLDPEVVYCRKHFDDELREVLPYGLIVSIMLLLMITVEADKAPVIDEDSDISSFQCPPNEEFKRRLNEVVEDYIAMGVL